MIHTVVACMTIVVLHPRKVLKQCRVDVGAYSCFYGATDNKPGLPGNRACPVWVKKGGERHT